MELSEFFQSVIDQDASPVVICSLDHEIIYMNPASVKRYERQGGADLVGRSLFFCHNEESRAKIEKVISWFRESKDHNRIYTFRNDKENKDVYMVALRDRNGDLMGYYEKHEYRDRETGGLYWFGQQR